MYYLDLTSTEMNADTVAIIIKSSNAKQQDIVLYPQEAGDIRVNPTYWNDTAVTTPNTAGTPVVDVGRWVGAVPSALISGRVDATVGALQAAVITAAAIAADAITSTKIADGALTAAKFAASALDAVWSTAVRLLTAGTNIALAKGTGVTGFNDLSAAQVNAEVVDVLVTDTFAEPAAVPAATSSLKDKLGWLFVLARNKRTQTATTQTVLADDGTTSVATSATSDSGSVFTSGEWS